MIKTLIKVALYLNIIKAIYDKPTANIISSGEKLSLPAKFRKRQECPLSSLLFNNIGKQLLFSNSRPSLLFLAWYCVPHSRVATGRGFSAAHH